MFWLESVFDGVYEAALMAKNLGKWEFHEFRKESQLHESMERYILIHINNYPLKAEKRTSVRFSAAPPPRGIQLDVKLVEIEFDEGSTSFLRR